MPIFSQLKQALTQKLENGCSSQELLELTANITLNGEDFCGLSWLKGQNVFPHYFWQHREQDFQLIALGTTAAFDDLQTADAFSRKHQVRLLGGMQFEGKTRFILPRLLLVKNQHNLTACCYFKAHESHMISHWLAALSEPKPLETQLLKLESEQAACNFSQWQANIEKAISQIQQQQFDKVVLANAKTLRFNQTISAYDLLGQSRQKNLGCYHFLWSESGEESFIGSSPERLYQRQDRTFITEALAGTVAVSADPIETEKNALWLLNDHKNIYENWLVVDDICGHLADCTQDIDVSEAEIKRLRNVQHLRRKLRTQLMENISDYDCLSRIHPTAAVAGLPREAAKAFIAENECFKRDWYAGSFGYFSPESAEFCVTLRSALIQDNQITIYAGAGIVAESDPHSEWQEIERKSQAMLGLLSS